MRRGEDGIEALLREALAPVEPPEGLEPQLERALGSLVDAAADEWEAWELSAMRDPRNWLRPAGAVVVGSAAAAGLVVVRTRRARHGRRAQARHPVDLLTRTARDLRREAGRVVRERPRRRGAKEPSRWRAR